jgi:hypothetical protein
MRITGMPLGTGLQNDYFCFLRIARIARDGGDADHAQTLLGGRLGKRQGSWREAATNFPKELFER